MRALVLLLRSLALIICSAVAVIAFRHNPVLETSVHQNVRSHNHRELVSVSFIDIFCKHSAYPDVCTTELKHFPAINPLTASPLDVVGYALSAAASRVDEAHSLAMNCSSRPGLTLLEGQCTNVCMELMSIVEDQMKLAAARLLELHGVTNLASLERSLKDVKVWLSSSLSYQTACTDNFQVAPGSIQEQIQSNQAYLSDVLGVSLSMVDMLCQVGNKVSSWVGALPPSSPPFVNVPAPPLGGKRRLLSTSHAMKGMAKSASDIHDINEADGLPHWISASGRRILQESTSSLAASANVVVAKDGSGTYTTITAAVNGIPSNYSGRYIIYIKQGVYEEVFNVTKDQQDITLVGDGINKTTITGSRNVASGDYTTYRSSTVGVSGSGFYARAITFRNTAGPSGHQAVAMRAGADFMVFYQCGFEGYQDTLYALSSRQFYRECEIYGTVDFIFGNAIAVFQRCKLLARLPLQGQQNTYTAQGRKLESDVSGYSFQNCTVMADSSLSNANYNVSTYLGRPWKAYSRVVFMESELEAVVDPAGWLQWNSSNPFEDTLYYGEYDNRGAGSDTSKRVNWPGVHPNMSESDASQFTVDNFIAGESWISAVQVSYQASL